jgi:UPF0755 protein
MMRRLGLLALLAIAAIGAAAGWLAIQLDKPYRGHRPAEVYVDIPHGTSRWRISGILTRDDVIRNRIAFLLFSEWHFRHPLQAGEYLVERPMNSRELFWKIAKGHIFVHTVVVPEGWTMYDIADELNRQHICGRNEFLIVAHDTALISDLAPHAQSLEGFLFPSTYEFTRHTTCVDVAKRMISMFRTEWEAIDPGNSLPLPQGLSMEKVVTMASLVERETPSPGERPLVAGVFYNRLRLGYPLQCDPTVQYAFRLDGHVERNLHPTDLRINSPYNTYEHRGLPPGPIANPGQASLQASIAPANTDYLYFVANAEGGHYFSRTLAEHDRNVDRLRRALESESNDPRGKKSRN